VWSAGMIAFELLTRQRFWELVIPFDKRNLLELMKQTTQFDPSVFEPIKDVKGLNLFIVFICCILILLFCLQFVALLLAV
jgi:hypothetical protein